MFTKLLDEDVIDEMWWFVAPVIIGSDGLSVTKIRNLEKMSEAIRLGRAQWHTIGHDVLGLMCAQR